MFPGAGVVSIMRKLSLQYIFLRYLAVYPDYLERDALEHLNCMLFVHRLGDFCECDKL